MSRRGRPADRRGVAPRVAAPPPAAAPPRPAAPARPELPPPDLTPAERIHFDLLARWRDAMDLVGPGPLAPHFVDAAAAVEGLPVAGRWADLGSGAGFPGIALAARYPQAELLLVESRRKRALFLESVVDAAGPLLARVTVHHGRTEDLDGPFDGVISRAYKPPEGVLLDADRLLGAAGVVVLMLGDSEWTPPPGWEVTRRRRYAVPDGHRRVLVLRRDEAGP